MTSEHIAELEDAVNELPGITYDRLRYDRALYRQLPRRRRLTASEKAWARYVDLELAGRCDELTLAIQLRRVADDLAREAFGRPRTGGGDDHTT